MELKEHNIMRQGRYRLEPIPSYLISQAMRLGEERKAKRDRVHRLIERATMGVIALSLFYFGWHIALWVL